MSFYPREHVGSQACCPLEGFASCVCSQETGQGLGSAARNGQGVYLWPLELTHQLFLSFPLTQGKLASFFLSRVDALSPQLQQVKGKGGWRAWGSELELHLCLILSVSLVNAFGPCSHFLTC